MSFNMSRNSVQPSSTDHLPECESLRGIAILLVFCFHYLGSLHGYQPQAGTPPVVTMLFGGDGGVTLFFVLSGFLLSRPFLLGARLHLGSYILRRALRILPMFYLLVLIAALWTGQWQQALSALFFQDIRVGVLPPMGNVWWSLVIEVQFYLLLPLFVWLLRSRAWRHLMWLLVPVAIYVYYRVCAAGLEQGFWSDNRNNILGRWPLFAVGVALAWIQLHFGRAASRNKQQGLLGLLLLVIAIVALEQLTAYRVRKFGAYAHVFWFDHYLWEAIAWATLVFALMNFRFLGRGLFINSPLHHLGLWSYSFYLLHSSVIFFILKSNTVFRISWRPSDWLEELALGAILFLLATALSACTYRWIELPFLRLKTNLGSKTWTKEIKV